MKRVFLPVCLLVAAAAAHAQEQEQGLSQRLKAQWDMQQVNPMQNQSFGGKSFGTKTFQSGAYEGVKSAPLKTFETRSFFGIKNPWFGKKVFGTRALPEAGRSAKEASRQFETDAFAVREYDKSRKRDFVDADASLPAAAQPRKYRGPEQPNKAKGIDKFTENLQKDLSIDDVRDLLNKGKGE